MELNLDYKNYSPSLFQQIDQFATSATIDEKITSAVTEILQDVRENGDQALLERTSLYDRANLNKSDIRVSIDEINSALKSLSSVQKTAIEEAVANVTLFHKQNLPKELGKALTPMEPY